MRCRPFRRVRRPWLTDRYGVDRGAESPSFFFPIGGVHRPSVKHGPEVGGACPSNSCNRFLYSQTIFHGVSESDCALTAGGEGILGGGGGTIGKSVDLVAQPITLHTSASKLSCQRS